MRQFISVVLVLLFLAWIVPAIAQTPGNADVVLRPLAATSGTGLSNAALIDRPEVRLLRVDIAPGGVRVVHTHDDVQFHLFVPITGRMQFQIDTDKPVDLTPWQPIFVKGGTKHGFTNPGTTPVSVMEIFVKK